LELVLAAETGRMGIFLTAAMNAQVLLKFEVAPNALFA
jgi:hypothetical protein